MNAFIASILGIGKAIWPYIAPLLAKGTLSALASILPIAREAVVTLWGQDKSGTEKRQEAIAKVKEIAIAEGMRISDSIVSLSIELALQRVKDMEAKLAAERVAVVKPEEKK